jgi:hypothetical protein
MLGGRRAQAALVGVLGIACAFADGPGDEPGADAAARPGDACTAETCNGRDDDCDGQVDEDYPERGQSCDGNDADQCAEGTRTCVGAAGAVCSDETDDTVELCNGADDDCDGMIDEEVERQYDLTTGAVASSSMICCESGDQLLGVVDCGVGANHGVTEDAECGIPWEGPGNGGNACAVITCSGPCPAPPAP